MPISNFKELELIIANLGVDVQEQNRAYLKEYEGAKDIESLNEIFASDKEAFLDISPQGEIRMVALFISQPSESVGHDIIYNVEKRHKYHLFNCQTLQKYPISRKYRFKSTIELNSLFPYMIKQKNKVYKPEELKKGRKLYFCEQCNKILKSRYGNYGRKGTFRLKKLIADACTGKIKTNVSGVGYDSVIGDVPRLYPENWKQIATKQKEYHNWKCQKCKIDLSNNKQWLDAHHMDGDPSNSIIANIQVLCIGCHAEQTMHGHIKTDERYKSYMGYKNSLS